MIKYLLGGKLLMKTKDLIKDYLIQCRNIKKLETLTIKAYTIDLKQFNEYIENLATPIFEINYIDKSILTDYINLISTLYKAKSLKRKIASLKAFFNYLEFEDIITSNPLRKIRLTIKEPKRLPKSLSIFDIEKILKAIYSKNIQSFSHLRNIAVFEILFATGIRVSELCNLKILDYNIDTQVLHIRGKGNKERLIYISNRDALSSLSIYMSNRTSDNEYLFINRLNKRLSEQSVRFFIQNLGKNILNKYVSPHMIRHSFATLMIEEGVDVTYIQSFLGHSSITTTQIYTVSTINKQRQIMTSFHPRNRILLLMKDNY